jgi:acyl-coenzyme A synthetase/AMP-(fatty) acid ligase
MEGATTNICYNLLDRNVKNGLGDKIAYYWWVEQCNFIYTHIFIRVD